MVQVEPLDEERGPAHPRAGEVRFHGDRRSSPACLPRACDRFWDTSGSQGNTTEDRLLTQNICNRKTPASMLRKHARFDTHWYCVIVLFFVGVAHLLVVGVRICGGGFRVRYTVKSPIKNSAFEQHNRRGISPIVKPSCSFSRFCGVYFFSRASMRAITDTT